MWASEPENVEFRNFMIDWLRDEKDEIERALNPSPEMVERMEARLRNRVLNREADAPDKQATPPPPKKKEPVTIDPPAPPPQPAPPAPPARKKAPRG